MMLIKSPNISSKRRWQVLPSSLSWNKLKNFYFLYKVKTFRKKTLINTSNIYGNKYFYKTFLFNVFIIKLKFTPIFVESYFYEKNPTKELLFCKNIYNQTYLIPSTNYTKIGFVFYPLNFLLLNKVNFSNQFLPIYIIPINTLISNLFNFNNNCVTYAVSSGCYAEKKKNLKKIKLIYIQLPSKIWKLFPFFTYCLLANTTNYFYNKVIEGGWGTCLKKKKKINVRGVAMNPVDHPNGGRTKAKQPELSPWGWIAKKSKIGYIKNVFFI